MVGSWAGAMGQTQFMPDSFLRFAVDFDGDGRRDMWNSFPDVFASTANNLAMEGWKADLPWGLQARLPVGFEAAMAGRATRRPVAEWARLGVVSFDGRALPPGDVPASVILPGGIQSDAFLVSAANFRALRAYNPSDYYALSIGLCGPDRRLRRAAPLLLAAALAGCTAPGGPAPVPTPAHYVVGEPYRTGGVWRYPREQFAYTDTGLATVLSRDPGPTADGEAFDPDLLTAAHRTLQLPAVARVTNLQTGRAILVRLNDRGPEAPGRLIAVTPRAAALLGVSGTAPFRVRVELAETESRQLATALATAAPLQMASAPVGSVQAESLAPPAGAAQSGRV